MVGIYSPLTHTLYVGKPKNPEGQCVNFILFKPGEALVIVVQKEKYNHSAIG